MKMFAKWSMVLVVGALLMVVSGCKKEKVAPAAAEALEEVATAVEAPAADAAAVEDLAVEEALTDATVEDLAADVPMDHPAH